MPIYKIRATRVTADEADVYVYADSAAQARERVEEDLDDIIEAYSAWDPDDFACESAIIDSVKEVDKLPKMWSIPDELDFRVSEPAEGEDPPHEPVDPRQMKLPV